MPKLSRTAKFADLRNQLQNDKEELINSKELSNYQNRLNNVENTLSPNRDKQDFFANGPITDDPIFQELIQKEAGIDFSQFKPVEEPVIENPVREEIVAEPVIEETPVVEEAPVVEEVPVVEETPAIEQIIEEPVIEEAIIEEISEPVEEQAVQEEPVIEDVLSNENISVFGNQPVQEEHVVEDVLTDEPISEAPQQESSFFDSFMNDTPVETNLGNNFNSYFESNEAKELYVEDMFNDVFKDVEDESGEIVSLKERETYLNQTLSDVNSYNKEVGEETINTAVDNLINEIRHPESRFDEMIEKSENEEDYLDADKVQVSTPEEDEEFTSTLSMEISKIMDEVANVSSDNTKFEEVEVKVPEEEVQEETENKTIQINEVPEEKAEDVVEIKNIAEIENEEVNTMSQTIPFVVAADDEELIDEEDEEDGSNVVLNIILIVLIIVLVAVLGLIVFYILKTKGIL